MRKDIMELRSLSKKELTEEEKLQLGRTLASMLKHNEVEIEELESQSESVFDILCELELERLWLGHSFNRD